MPDAWPQLLPGEVLLPPANDSVVLRHVHPTACDGDKIESWAFAPNSGDEGKMSVTQLAQVNIAESFESYAATHKSAGMWGVSTAEVADVGSRVVDDRALNPDLPSGHAYVDFRDVLANRRQVSKRARALRDRAVQRGRIYGPADD